MSCAFSGSDGKESKQSLSTNYDFGFGLVSEPELVVDFNANLVSYFDRMASVVLGKSEPEPNLLSLPSLAYSASTYLPSTPERVRPNLYTRILSEATGPSSPPPHRRKSDEKKSAGYPFREKLMLSIYFTTIDKEAKREDTIKLDGVDAIVDKLRGELLGTSKNRMEVVCLENSSKSPAVEDPNTNALVSAFKLVSLFAEVDMHSVYKHEQQFLLKDKVAEYLLTVDPNLVLNDDQALKIEVLFSDSNFSIDVTYNLFLRSGLNRAIGTIKLHFPIIICNALKIIMEKPRITVATTAIDNLPAVIQRAQLQKDAEQKKSAEKIKSSFAGIFSQYQRRLRLPPNLSNRVQKIDESLLSEEEAKIAKVQMELRSKLNTKLKDILTDHQNAVEQKGVTVFQDYNRAVRAYITTSEVIDEPEKAEKMEKAVDNNQILRSLGRIPSRERKDLLSIGKDFSRVRLTSALNLCRLYPNLSDVIIKLQQPALVAPTNFSDLSLHELINLCGEYPQEMLKLICNIPKLQEEFISRLTWGNNWFKQTFSFDRANKLDRTYTLQLLKAIVASGQSGTQAADNIVKALLEYRVCRRDVFGNAQSSKELLSTYLNDKALNYVNFTKAITPNVAVPQTKATLAHSPSFSAAFSASVTESKTVSSSGNYNISSTADSVVQPPQSPTPSQTSHTSSNSSIDSNTLTTVTLGL